MNVLIIGINGFLGASIATGAIAGGCRVTGMARSSTSTFDGDIAYIVGDRRNSDLVRKVVMENKIDVVVDVIAMTISTTDPILSCLDGLVDHYIMVSSSDVYANYELLHRRVKGDPELRSVDEDSPLRSTLFPYRESKPRKESDPDKYLDEYDKIPIEQAVQRLSSAWTVLRLPMVYGPGDKQHRFRWAIEPMLRGADRLVIPIGWSNWVSTYGYIDNVGAAVAFAAGNASSKNCVFNLAEINPVSQLEWAKKFARHLKWDGVIEMTDDPGDDFARRVSRLDLNVPLKISGTRFRNGLGYADLVDERTALERTIASELENMYKTNGG